MRGEIRLSLRDRVLLKIGELRARIELADEHGEDEAAAGYRAHERYLTVDLLREDATQRATAARIEWWETRA